MVKSIRVYIHSYPWMWRQEEEGIHHRENGRQKKAIGWGGRQQLRENVSWKKAQTPQKQLWLMWGDEIVAEGQQSGTEHCGPDGPIRWPDSTRSWGPRPWWKQPVSTDRCLSGGPVQRTVSKHWQSLKPLLLMFFPVPLLPGLAGLWALFERWPLGGWRRKVKLNGSAEGLRRGGGVPLVRGAGGVRVSLTHLDCTTSIWIQQGEKPRELAHSVMPGCGHHDVSCSALVPILKTVYLTNQFLECNFSEYELRKISVPGCLVCSKWLPHSRVNPLYPGQDINQAHNCIPFLLVIVYLFIHSFIYSNCIILLVLISVSTLSWFWNLSLPWVQ